MPFAVPPLHCFLAEPVVLAVHSSPVPLADVIPQVRRAAGQPLQLIGALNVEFTGQIHTQTEKPSRLPTGGTGLKAKGPTADCPRGQSPKSCFDLRSSTSVYMRTDRICAQTEAESVFGSHGAIGPLPPGEKSRGTDRFTGDVISPSHLKEGPLLLLSRSTQ